MNGDSNEVFAAVSEDFDAPSPDRDASDDPGDERRLIALIRERPWTCVLAAAGIGFLMARLLRGRERVG